MISLFRICIVSGCSNHRQIFESCMHKMSNLKYSKQNGLANGWSSLAHQALALCVLMVSFYPGKEGLMVTIQFLKNLPHILLLLYDLLFVVYGGFIQKPPHKNLVLSGTSPSDEFKPKDSHESHDHSYQSRQLYSADYSFGTLDQNVNNVVQPGIEAKERVTSRDFTRQIIWNERKRDASKLINFHSHYFTIFLCQQTRGGPFNLCYSLSPHCLAKSDLAPLRRRQKRQAVKDILEGIPVLGGIVGALRGIPFLGDFLDDPSAALALLGVSEPADLIVEAGANVRCTELRKSIGRSC